MADHHRQGECRPIQTSAVIVLCGSKTRSSSIPPPSPPTPCVSPGDADLYDPIDPFRLAADYSEDEIAKDRRLRSGVHVLNTESVALSNLARVYETHSLAREGFNRAVQAITRQQRTKGKLIVIGVGKSGHIGKKLVATFKSLSIRAVFLHATEAMHGDLGVIDSNDTLMFITYSGKTPELLLMLPHLDVSLPTIIITSHLQRETCEFFNHRPNSILVPAPITELEAVSFGVSAPSTSTTVALALGDALALTAAAELYPNVSVVFAKNHPGGAIGAAVKAATKRPNQTLHHICTPLGDIPIAKGLSHDSLGIDLFRAGYDSKSGWLRVQDTIAAPRRVRNMSQADLCRPLREVPGLVLARHQMLAMSSDTTIRQASEIIQNMQAEDDEEMLCMRDSIMAVTEKGNIVGVIEVGQVLNHE